ncbi:glycoside hydrolase family 19 protein [Pseudomonas sp. RIT-To-2]|uniref:glycoside hydrolase family 19 protein n=1 Tax=Pseudomonas sp. RIT-To-2 TaxID=3462541 RepID=UPI0024132E89
MLLNEQQLLQILPDARPVAGIFLPALNQAMQRYRVDSCVRIAAFLAQVGYESGSFRRLAENLSYSAQRIRQLGEASAPGSRWRSLVPMADQLAHNPQALAEAAYGGRLGNDVAGDGYRYRGRGLIQLTGKGRYRLAGQALGQDLVAAPQWLETPEGAALSAAWFWADNGLNELADAGRFSQITRRINGGLNGAQERLLLRDRAATVLAQATLARAAVLPIASHTTMESYA